VDARVRNAQGADWVAGVPGTKPSARTGVQEGVRPGIAWHLARTGILRIGGGLRGGTLNGNSEVFIGAEKAIGPR